MILPEEWCDVLPHDHEQAVLVGCVHDPEIGGPCVVVVRGDDLVDITHDFPTVADLMEQPDAVAAIHAARGSRS